jgi:hypothetical protein
MRILELTNYATNWNNPQPEYHRIPGDGKYAGFRVTGVELSKLSVTVLDLTP